ncbi:MAG: holo-ACP synthase [Tissierellaceae bacterium]
MIITGVDIVKIERIKEILDNRKESLYEKIFTVKEIAYIENRGNNPSTVAGLFASKEAVSKALGTGIGKVSWKDIEVLHNKNGKPFINISEKISSILDELNIEEIDISISHEEEYAIAFVVGYGYSKL